MILIKRKDAIARGLKRYRTGKACPEGHLDERYVSGSGCVACARERIAKKRKENPGMDREANAKWYRRNAEKKRKYSYEWKKLNPEKVKENNAKWYRENPDANREKCSRRRAAQLASEGVHTANDIERIYGRQKERCASCRGSLNSLGYHVDHIVPLSKGGSNGPENIQILCPSCNCKKKDKDPIAWANQRGMLL